MDKRKKDKRTNNDLQNITQKTKDRATRPHIKPGSNSGSPGGFDVPVPLMTPVVLLLNVYYNTITKIDLINSFRCFIENKPFIDKIVFWQVRYLIKIIIMKF